MKKEDIHCTCIIPGQDLGLTASLLECAKSYQSLNFSPAILNPA